mgnify:CR=1 FL=1
MWQWYHATRSKMSASKPLLLINMDETAVCSFQGDFRGNVVAQRKGDSEPVQPYNRGRRRLHLTYACFICNSLRVQKKLPQVILMNEHACTASEYQRILAETPPHIYVKKRKSAWMNEETMCVLVRLLHAHLRDELPHYQVVLFLDAFRGHIHYNVQLQCNRLGIVLIIIPANLTWLLQPCDTHVFSIFKKYMRQLWARMTDLAPNGFIDIVAMVRLLFETITHIVQGRDWSHAFKADGFFEDFTYLSSYIMRNLQYKEQPAIITAVPSLEGIKHCFPRNTVVHGRLVLKLLHQPDPVLALPPPAAPLLALPPPVQVGGASSSAGPAQPAPRASPLIPRRPIPALAISSNTTSWAASQQQENEDRESQRKPPPVTRQMTRAMKAQAAQPDEEAQQVATSRAASSQGPEPAPKRRKLPWKT